MLLQLIDVPHWFLINMFLRVGFSRCLLALLYWCDFHAARGEVERCIKIITVMSCCSNSCCQTSVKLLATFAFQRTMSTELLRHKTPDFTPDVASQQTRPQFCRLQIIESHSGMHLSETAMEVKHHWWAVVINRMTYYISQGRVATFTRRGGQLYCNSLANLLRYPKNYKKQYGLTKLLQK